MMLGDVKQVSITSNERRQMGYSKKADNNRKSRVNSILLIVIVAFVFVSIGLLKQVVGLRDRVSELESNAKERNDEIANLNSIVKRLKHNKERLEYDSSNHNRLHERKFPSARITNSVGKDDTDSNWVLKKEVKEIDGAVSYELTCKGRSDLASIRIRRQEPEANEYFKMIPEVRFEFKVHSYENVGYKARFKFDNDSIITTDNFVITRYGWASIPGDGFFKQQFFNRMKSASKLIIALDSGSEYFFDIRGLGEKYNPLQSYFMP